MDSKMTPFVKWAGGKRQLLNKLKPLMPKEYNKYYEPFVGGGALLFDQKPKCACINDNNKQLIIYRQLKQDENAVISFLDKLETHSCDAKRYSELKNSYNAKITNQELDPECAALMIWINKHCFNGLYRVNSKGLFNVPYNKKSITPINRDNLKNVAHYLRENIVDIKDGDFEDAVLDAKPGDFVYFDPPYLPISHTSNFTSYTKDAFSLDDHKRLARLFKTLAKRGVFVLLSNHNVPLIDELYNGFVIERIPVRRAINSDASKRFGEEVIVRSY